MSYEAVVSSFAERLGDLLIEEAPLLYGVRDSLEWIRRELKSMQSFLKDAESKQKEDARVKNWVAQIRDVCFEAEDVIDTFILSQTAKKRDGFAGLVNGSTFLSRSRTRYKLGEQIEKIKQKISDIKMKRADYGIRDISEGRQEAGSSSQNLQERRRSSALLQETEVVGQRDEINSVKKQLMSDEPRRCVISIFGMGGSGKTTIARKVYHDVKNDFDCHAFICLSQQYEMKDVLIRLITCAMGKLRGEIENLTEKKLEMMLGEHLKGKRYLVIIDDIWSIKAWDDLKLVLPDACRNKSRVMLTTRIKDVALHADPSGHHHEMRLLNADECWKLFMKIFPGEDPSTTALPAELVETGRNILAKCGGLPLAILVLGGLLSIKDKKFDAWSKVLESFQELYGSFDLLWRILAFSYWDLPYYLKPCFLYLGLFPEDSEIGSGRLIRLWIAEGFIEQKGNQIMEDIAEAYLKELVDRNMIQVTRWRSNGSIKTCRIHDLLRDFSISEARQNNFFAISSVEDISSSLTNARRLALHNSIHGYLTTNRSTAILRSLLCFLRSEVPLSELQNIGGKLLRVLVADGAEFTKEQLPMEVGPFVHLRYLELATTKDRSLPSSGSLPSSIANLSNLQTLKLPFDGTLPHAIWNLVQLRHLSLYHYKTDGHPKLHNLSNLQTLCLRAGSWIEYGLSKLTNLRKLVINGDLSSYHKALSHSIYELRNLRSLKIYDGHSIPLFKSFTHHLHLYKMYLDGEITKELPVLPPNVVELTLKNSLLVPDAISMLEKLPDLMILRLLRKSYDNNSMTCSSRGFPRLEMLELCELPLECLKVEDEAMANLKSVQLSDMSKLETDTIPERVRALLKQN